MSIFKLTTRFVNFFFQQVIKPFLFFPFNPGFMPAFFQQNKPEILQNSGQGFFNSLKRVWIIVSVNCNYRACDFCSQFQKLAVTP